MRDLPLKIWDLDRRKTLKTHEGKKCNKPPKIHQASFLPQILYGLMTQPIYKKLMVFTVSFWMKFWIYNNLLLSQILVLNIRR